MKSLKYPNIFMMLLLFMLTAWSPVNHETRQTEIAGNGHYLYVAVPGIRNYLEYGGHGVLVFDIDDNHRFIKRIPSQGLKADGTPSNVKGTAVSVAHNSIYVSTLEALQRIDLSTEKIVWEKRYEGGCDRMAMSPDGKIIYLPSLEKEHWNVVDAGTGEVIKTVVTNSGAHNTIYGADGGEVYMAGLRTNTLGVADTKTHTVVRQVGPFANAIRPFTVNGSQTRCFVNINGLLGFEAGDLKSGKKLYSIKVEGFEQGPVKRHGCPSHGIGLTPDEKEIWLCDAFNQRMHIFDNTVEPAKQKTSIALRDQPGWVTFSIEGKYAYPSTGEVIDVKTREIIATLKEENGNPVHSEKVVEIFFRDGKAVKVGDQFGVGRRK